jgi:hypothetical protein
MKTKTKLALVVGVSGGVGLVLGSQGPVMSIMVHLSDTTVTSFQRFDLLVRFLAAAGTFLAVVVALFKEEIRSLWEHASLTLTARDAGWVKEILEGSADDESGGDSDGPEAELRSHRAENYEAVLQVANTGNVPAKSCEVRLDRLTFREAAEAHPQELDCGEEPIGWRGTNEHRVTILPDRHAWVEVVSLTAPKRSSKGNAEAGLSIASAPMAQRAGTWVATFSVYGENIRLTKIELTIWWNGQWEPRKTEMTQRFTIKQAKP